MFEEENKTKKTHGANETFLSFFVRAAFPPHRTAQSFTLDETRFLFRHCLVVVTDHQPLFGIITPTRTDLVIYVFSGARLWQALEIPYALFPAAFANA